MISTKQLAYALAVERNLHFKKAAEQCHITQSALSTALAELEKQLGFQLFERDNKRVLVTPIGAEVLRRARDIMSRVEELERLANQEEPLEEVDPERGNTHTWDSEVSRLVGSKLTDFDISIEQGNESAASINWRREK